MHYTLVRELARVVEPATELEWIEHARGKNRLQVQELVSGHRKGALPTDEPDDNLREREIRFDLTPDVFALIRDTRLVIERECGEHLDDNKFIEAVCRRALDGGTRDEGRAAFQIAITTCSHCERGWHEAAGASIEISARDIERARCDAQHIGAVDALRPERAHQDVSPATRRFVLRRDHGRCVVPGCRSARGLNTHHIVPRSEGGSHEPWNLVTLCSAHHRQLHDGLLRIIGRAPDHLSFSRVNGEDALARSETSEAPVFPQEE